MTVATTTIHNVVNPLTLTLFVHAPVNDFGIYDVGANKAYVNQGLLRHEIETRIAPQIKKTLQSLAFSPKHSFNLAIEGFILPLLKRYVPETLSLVQTFVREKKVKLLLMPYYGTSLQVCSQENFLSQLSKEKETLKTFFLEQPTAFFSSDGQIPSLFTQNNDSFTKIVTGKKVVGEVSLFTLTKQVIATPTIALADESFSQAVVTPLQNNLLQEYTLLASHVFATGDADLLMQWNLLGQRATFVKADESLYANEAYDQYASVMNILNDIAHEIKSVELGKQGRFATSPVIVSSPARMLETMKY